MIRPGRLWWHIHRDLKRGLSAAYNDRMIAPRIWTQPPPHHADVSTEIIDVHVITGAEQFDLAGWMLASWFHETGRNWRIILHDDGTLDESHHEKFSLIYPDATIRHRSDSDQEMESVLRDYPECWKARQHFALSLKFFDTDHISGGEPFIVLDTDILFYDRPSFMLEWVDGKHAGSYFMRDIQSAYTTDAAECSAAVGVELWPAINSGICLVEPGTLDIDFTERFLEKTKLFDRPGWTHEQTLFAVNASRYQLGGHLDGDEYELTLDPHRDTSACCRHYVGRVRDYFYSEGVSNLKTTLLS